MLGGGLVAYGANDDSSSSSEEEEQQVDSIGIVLPPEIEAELPAVVSRDVKPKAAEKVATFLNYRRKGHHFMTNLKGKKDFKNPYILDKVVDYFRIDDIQSNFNKRVFDPQSYSMELFYDNLALAQKKYMQGDRTRKKTRWE